jgi:hypothetical protein
MMIRNFTTTTLTVSTKYYEFSNTLIFKEMKEEARKQPAGFDKKPERTEVKVRSNYRLKR